MSVEVANNPFLDRWRISGRPIRQQWGKIGTAATIGGSVVRAPVPDRSKKLRQEGPVAEGNLGTVVSFEERLFPEFLIEQRILESARRVGSVKENRFQWASFSWAPHTKVEVDEVFKTLGDFADNHRLDIPRSYYPEDVILRTVEQLKDFQGPLTFENQLRAIGSEDNLWSDTYRLALALRLVSRDADKRMLSNGGGATYQESKDILMRMQPFPDKQKGGYGKENISLDVVGGDNYHFAFMFSLLACAENHKRELQHTGDWTFGHAVQYGMFNMLLTNPTTATKILRGRKQMSGHHETVDHLAIRLAKRYERIANGIEN